MVFARFWMLVLLVISAAIPALAADKLPTESDYYPIFNMPVTP